MLHSLNALLSKKKKRNVFLTPIPNQRDWYFAEVEK